MEGLEVVYTQKLRGRDAVRYYRLGRPLKTLVEDYKELTSKISGKEGGAEGKLIYLKLINPLR